ncbi:MAG: GTPase [Glaciimonas sp.]|nr:GTPase [Glaciimonas sp.]
MEQHQAYVYVTLVTGTNAAARECVIAAAIQPAATDEAGFVPNGTVALILEGFPSGLSQQAAALDPQHNPALMQTARIAPGCLCCVGNLTLKVTLNRILRQRPQRLYISLATATHIVQLRAFLSQPPYDRLLKLTDDLIVDC